MTDLLATLVPALGWALLHFLWQGALIGLVAGIALAFLREARPQARYAVAGLALLTCALLPLWHVLQSLGTAPVPAMMPIVSASTNATAPLASNSPASSAWPFAFDAALPWIVAGWAAGASALSLRMAFGLAWVNRLCRAEHTRSDACWQARLQRIAMAMGIRREVLLRICTDGDSPVSAGLWRPVVLVPAALFAGMPADLLEALIVHELAHIRRHDYLVNLLQGVVEALLFYHPVVWWLSRCMRIEREQIADDIAAKALGEPRRLAIALSELEHFTLPAPYFAQAAHGGQLMSRIQHLLRPDRSTRSGKFAFPALGLIAACLAFYAHAQISTTAAAPAATVLPDVALAGTPASAASPTIRPAVAGEATDAAAASPAIAGEAAIEAETAQEAVSADDPIEAEDASDAIEINSGDDESDTPRHESFALVRKGRDGITMSGDSKDIDAIRDAQRRIDGDFLWFRRQDKAYIVRDPALLARADQAWQSVDKFDGQMDALSRQMDSHNDRMEALNQQIEALNAEHVETPAMAEATRKIQSLADQQQAMARQEEQLARQDDRGDDSKRAALERQMAALDAQTEALDQQMERLNQQLEAENARLEASRKPMEDLERQMEQAAQPMEAVGKQMEALGKQQERAAAIADRAILELIDQALDKGLTTPAPR